MKKVNSKIKALHTRIENLQEWLDEYRAEVDEQHDELENEPNSLKKYDKLGETLEYIDNVYEALNTCICELENYMED